MFYEDNSKPGWRHDRRPNFQSSHAIPRVLKRGQGRKRFWRLGVTGLTLLSMTGCRIPGHHFGAEVLQLRTAQGTNETILTAQQPRFLGNPGEQHRSAQADVIILAAN